MSAEEEKIENPAHQEEDDDAPKADDEDTGAHIAPIVKLEEVTVSTVLPSMSLQEHAGSDKSWVWHAQDFADGELKKELFTMRFGSPESAQKFKSAFEEAQEKMAAILGTTDAAKEVAKEAEKTAEELEKLAVKKDEKPAES
ncbi:unnamed protein product [Closterium sp. NIES-64]|nr:unnamed protein product [Closterium sp. NIES-64]